MLTGASVREANRRGQKDHPARVYSSPADGTESRGPGCPQDTHASPFLPAAFLLRGLCPQCCCTPPARMASLGQDQPGWWVCEDTVWVRVTEGLPTWCTQTLHLSQKTISLPSSPSGERHTSQTTSSSYSMPSPSWVSMARTIFWWHSVSSSSSTRSSVSSSSSGLSVRTAREGVRSPACQGRCMGGFPLIPCDLGKPVDCHFSVPSFEN